MGRILTVLFLGVLMAALDIAILGPAIPAIREAFQLTEREVSWVFTAWVFANLVGVPIMSKLADRVGRKRMYLTDIGLFALGGIVVASSPSFAWLLAGRALQGFAVSGIFPVAGAFIGDTFPSEKRGQAFGVLGSVFGVAFIIGPILAGMVLLVGWRWLYLAFVPIAIVVIGLGLWFLPASRPGDRRPLDVLGLVTLAGFLLSVAYGISMFNTDAVLQSLQEPRVLSAFVLAGVCLPLFIRAERRAADPILRLDLFSNRQVVLTCVMAAGAGINEAAFIFFPTIAVVAYGVTTSGAAFMLLPLMVSVALGSPVMGRLVDRFGSRAVVIGCNVALAIGMAGVATSPGVQAVFYGSSVLIGIGLAGLMGSALSYILIHEAREGEKTVSQGLITLFISLGQLLTGAAVGAVAASSGDVLVGYGRAFLGIAMLTIVLALLALRLNSRARERAAVSGSR